MRELLTSPAFRYYVIAAVILAFNPLVLSGITGGFRGKYKSPVTPEDAKLSGNPYREVPAPEVLRASSAHRNAVENVPLALISGLVYVLAGAPATMVAAFMGAIALFRWLHSVFYLTSVQPWRTASYAVAALALTGMLIHTLILVV
jgi:glutathione S-transferase